MTQAAKQFFSTHSDAAKYLGLSINHVVNVSRGRQIKGRKDRALTFCGKFPMSDGIEGDEWWRVDERVEGPRNNRLARKWDLPRRYSKAYRAAVACIRLAWFTSRQWVPAAPRVDIAVLLLVRSGLVHLFAKAHGYLTAPAAQCRRVGLPAHRLG